MHSLPLLHGQREAHFRQLFPLLSPWHWEEQWPRSLGPFLPSARALECAEGKSWGDPGLCPQEPQTRRHSSSSAPARLCPSMASRMQWGSPCWGIATGEFPRVTGQGSPALTPYG